MTAPHHLTMQLAEKILSYPSEALPVAIRSKAIDCVLDTVAACLAGLSEHAAVSARQMARRTFIRAEAPVWFTQSFLSPMGAAWCNSMAASSLDFDDGHRLARGHPGSAIIPAVLAHSAPGQHSTLQILAAIAIGYEVAISAAMAQQFDRAQTYQSGRWTGLGVVAACGRLASLEPGQLANALAIAGVWAPNQQANGSSGYAKLTGNWAKEGIPISTVQAMMALDLASSGFTGPLDLFDHRTHYQFHHPMDASWDPSLILGTYFKHYACCRYIHPALDAYSALQPDVGIDGSSVEHIDVSTFSWALRLANRVRPDNLVDVQFSLPFCLASLILHGPGALAPISQTLLGDDRIPALAERICLRADPWMDTQFPAETLASLRVMLKSGEVLDSLGAIAPCPTDIRRKFLRVADTRLSLEFCQRILDATDPEDCNLNKLQLALSQAFVIGR